jgi:hypothetical protein
VVMVSFLLALAPFIPVVLNVIGWLIKMFGTSEENLKLYGEMIQKNKDLGRVSVETARRHDEFYQQLLDEHEAKKKEKETQQ